MFHQAYFTHSLGVDWIVTKQPEVSPPLSPGKESSRKAMESQNLIHLQESQQVWVFLVHSVLEDEDLGTMVDKMIHAVGKKRSDIFVWNLASKQKIFSILKKVERPLGVFIFGDEFKPRASFTMGQPQREGQHRLMLSHDLRDLKVNPLLKRETWQHLQTFFGI